MNARLLSFFVAGVFTTSLVAGCASQAPDAVSGDESDMTSAVTCESTIKDRVLVTARRTDSTASVTSVTSLYQGGEQEDGPQRGFADALLVRVTGEKPSDYIVIRSYEGEGDCALEEPYLVAHETVPDSFFAGDIDGSSCMRTIKDAVLAKGLKVSETASIEDTKQVYGGHVVGGGALIVRVSDETEPTDYLAVFKMDDPQPEKDIVCSVATVKLLNEGVLPDMSKLGPVASKSACKRRDGTNASVGESWPDIDGCNTCTCRSDGRSVCTERFCPQ